MSKYKSVEVDINNNFKFFGIREDFSVIQPPRAYTYEESSQIIQVCQLK